MVDFPPDGDEADEPSPLGAETAGVWTRAQALARHPPGTVRGLLRDGVWQVLWPGVYADTGFTLSPEQRAFAAVLAGGGAGQPLVFGAPDPRTGQRRRRLVAVACGRTAARFWQLPLVDDDDPATGAAEHVHDDVSGWAHLRDLRHGGRVLHRRRLTAGTGDLVLTRGGLWVTSVLRTLVDCTGLLSREAAVCALDDALHRSLVTVAQLDAAVASRAGAPGARALADAVALADGRAESPFETLTRLLLQPALPDLEPQVKLCDDRGRPLARFDLGDRRRRLAVESDGRAAHSGTDRASNDRGRDRTAASYGWHTERLTWFEVRCRQAQTVARVCARAALLDRAAVRRTAG